MILSQQQLDISNKSYTNKDFASIYSELLSYATKISERFSPLEANETDPFIVMLKLAAFVSDKINYNVDKNILERFMLSCTQETSMQELTSIMGYHMHFYNAAKTEVVFSYAGELEKSLLIEKYSTVSTDDDIQFITLTDAEINLDTARSLPVEAIQGKLKTLSVLGNTKIQLENLDENNRIYFPEFMVAENGVMINDEYGVDWVKYDNLNNAEYLDYAYSFGYDSIRNLPYIEFPDWINLIIRDGLTIKYVVTNGYSGNIISKSLSKLSPSNAIDENMLKNISVSNSSGTVNGKDPETIDMSYKGFKKLVGTLDTLVTCRDYAARIYELLDRYDNPLVSNIIVSDRRTDINNSISVSTIDDLGAKVITESIKDSDKANKLTAYDLMLYGFRPILSKDFTAIKKSGGYNDSYSLMYPSTKENVINYIEADRSISHDYPELELGDIAAIYIMLRLNAVITTTSKVSGSEQLSIIENINNALIRDYNIREITPGIEIPYDSLLKTIQNADTRIKSVSLQEPEQTPEIGQVDTGNTVKSYELTETGSKFNFLIMKNIAAGKLAAFAYDDNFNYEYYYQNCEKYTNCKKITTNANITLVKEADNFATKLNANEVIQFIAPKFDTFVTYPYGVLYYLKLNNTSVNMISKNAEYRLTSDDLLILSYADSGGTYHHAKYYYLNDERGVVEELDGSTTNNTGIIISPNFDMYTSQYRINTGETVDKTFAINSESYSSFQLASNEEVQAKKRISETLSNSYYCYWSVNNSNNALMWVESRVESTSDDSTKITYIYTYTLNENEYFYYSDLNNTYYKEFGSGTTLKLISKTQMTKVEENNEEIGWSGWIISEVKDLSDIIENGLSALSSVFKVITFNNSYKLDIILNEIITLTEGDYIQCRISNSATIDTYSLGDDYDNKFDDIEGKISDITYVHDWSADGSNVSEMLPDRSSLLDDNWKMRTLLDLNCGPDIAQELNGNNSITITYEGSTEPAIISGEKSFKSNINLSISGGADIDLGYYTLENIIEANSYTDSEIEYPDFMAFSINNDTEGALINKLDNDGFYNISSGELTDINFYLPSGDDVNEKYYGLTIILPDNLSENDTKVIEFYTETGTATDVTNIYHNLAESEELDDNQSSHSISLVPGINTILFKKSNAMYFKINEIEDSNNITLRLSNIKIINSVNPAITSGDIEDAAKYIVDLFGAYIGNNELLKKAAILSDLDPVRVIETDEYFPMSSAQAFYDVNNVANSWVIPRIDFANSVIKIANSSIRR